MEKIRSVKLLVENGLDPKGKPILLSFASENERNQGLFDLKCFLDKRNKRYECQYRLFEYSADLTIY